MKTTAYLLVATVFAWTVSAWGFPAFSDLPAAAGPAFVPGQLLLKVAPGSSAKTVAGAVGGRWLGPVGDGSIALVEVAPGSENAAGQALNGRRDVAFAEPNWLRRLHAPDDPGFGMKWDLHNDGSLVDGSDRATTDADIDWLEAYGLLGGGFGGTAVVAVIDTGIDAAHPDLAGKIVGGYDYLSNDGNPQDTYGHGTHVAGIALAKTGNALGTVGVGFGDGILVMPLRVCDSGGCPTSAIVNAIYHAANNGADVINMSLGGRFGSASEQQAIDYAWGKGLVIVASSGNDGAGKVSYPAAFGNAIAVGSTNWHDQLAPYSNTGGDLDLVAPGGDMSKYHDPGGIYSTMPTNNVYLTTSYGYSRNYDQLQGTSMAAPQVAGLAALLFAANPVLTNAEVRSILESTADDLGQPGWDRNFGWGRINAYSAVASALGGGAGPTDEPPTVTLTSPANGATVLGTIEVSADAGDDNGVATVNFYLDNALFASDGDGSDGWSVSWDTTTASEGGHTLRATAVDGIGQTASSSINVRVDNQANAEVQVLAVSPATITGGNADHFTVSGSGFAAGAVLLFENGSGPAPSVSNPQVVNGGTLTADVTTKKTRQSRVWDVRVSNPDGSTGVLPGGFTILP